MRFMANNPFAAGKIGPDVSAHGNMATMPESILFPILIGDMGW